VGAAVVVGLGDCITLSNSEDPSLLINRAIGNAIAVMATMIQAAMAKHMTIVRRSDT
jgi:hypothetical protein